MYEYETRIMRNDLPSAEDLTTESTRGWELVQILPLTSEIIARMGIHNAEVGDCIVYFKRLKA